LSLPLKSLYATTEGGALTGARDEDVRLETVGPVHEGIEVKISDRGELLYRQPGVFVGYYKDPEKTAGVLKDGWFHSGDRCFMNEDGHVVFVDRVGDVVELACGDQLAPQSIESRLRFSPYIRDAWVFAGPEKAYASAMIIIHHVNVGRWAGQKRVAYNTFAELSQKPEVYELVAQEIDRINSSLSAGSKLKKYVNLHKEFDPEEGEITRTRKLRRAVLKERYRELIDAIYADKTEVPIEAQIKHQDGRTESTRTTLRIQSLKGVAL
jgi:long-chain acyl-CoA synthetase